MRIGLKMSHETAILMGKAKLSLRDNTPQLDDVGAVFYPTHTNFSNQDKFGTIDFTIDPSYYAPLPGRCLKYSSGSQSIEADGFTANAATCRAGANGHGWLIHDSLGNEFNYSGNRLTNPGNVDYQNDWKSRALTYLAANTGVDGLWIDNFEYSAVNFSTVPAVTYPVYNQEGTLIWNNATDYQDAQISFSNNAHAAIKAAGYLIVVNAKANIAGDNNSANGVLSKNWMDRYHTNVTGFTIENWQQDASDHSIFTAISPWDVAFKHAWNEWMSVMDYGQAYGLDFYPVDEVLAASLSDTRYFRASFLMNWNGGRGSVLFNPYTGVDHWNAAMAVDVGQPTAPKVSMGIEGCWKRNFERKTVYVNANPSTQTLDGHVIASGDGLFV